ncbi:MAG: antiterminator LoaP [Spirochaetaceae bacterium]|nr:antiterminator LoaP [Spirochaetaceae bacterium]
MNYYAVQVQTGNEEKIIDKAKKILQDRLDKQNFLFPKKSLKIRKSGLFKQELKPIFPGYFFIQVENIDTELYNTLKSIHGFYRFLKNNQEITPLTGKDLSILQHFLKFGQNISASQVYFDENDRICIVEGPLKGLEGLIIKVDKRKKRAKIKMDFANDSILIDLGFELIKGLE